MVFSPASLIPNLPPLAEIKRLVVAYSGGLDSHVLLHALARCRDAAPAELCLEALHIHHGVSQHADRWVAHCRAVCRALDIPLSVQYVRCSEQQASLENALRDARYRVFSAHLAKGDVLALAHHADDQAETVLLRMLRGSGPLGAAGMPSQRALGEGRLVRPLLSFSRSQLEDYARQQGLSWIEDESNTDTRYDRNYLRHQVMPLLEQRWPKCKSVISRYAQINRETQDCIDFFLQRELSEMMADHQQGLKIAWLANYEEQLQLNLLRAWLQCLGLAIPGYQQLLRVLSEVINARQDAQPLLCWPGVEVRRFQGVIYALTPLVESDPSRVFLWQHRQPLAMSGAGQLTLLPQTGAGLYLPSGSELTVRFRQGGERCQPLGRQGSHLLKKLLQEYRVPPWLRDRLPLIYIDGSLAAVADVWICEGFKAAAGQQGYALSWARP